MTQSAIGHLIFRMAEKLIIAQLLKQTNYKANQCPMTSITSRYDKNQESGIKL